MPVVLEATALTLSVNAFVKHLAGRTRPEDHFCEEEKLVVPCRPDTQLSFYSGHTSAAFVAAVAGGTLADFHRLQHRKWIWATGLTLATATGVLRVTADQHYATDVLTGMVAGSLAGWLIPKLHEPDPVEPAARPGYAGSGGNRSRRARFRTLDRGRDPRLGGRRTLRRRPLAVVTGGAVLDAGALCRGRRTIGPKANFDLERERRTIASARTWAPI